MKIGITLFLLVALCAAEAAPASKLLSGLPEGKVVVYAQDKERGFDYRIPALARTKIGRLLAFAERRVGLSDHAQNDIVLKHSSDFGKTWSDEILIADEKGDSLNDPTVIVMESGRVLLRYTRFPKGYHTVKGKHTKVADTEYDSPLSVRIYLMHSDDHGVTWSKPRDVTRMMRPEDRVHVGSPGVGIEMRSTKYKGRLVYPSYEAHYKDGSRKWLTGVCISDDGGDTWKRTADIPEVIGMPGVGNEAQVVELDEGKLLFSARSQGGAKRRFAISDDGGETWNPYWMSDDLVTPACMAAMIWYLPIESNRSSMILHTIPHGKGRSNGALFRSKDDGKSWRKLMTIEPKGFAYSCLVELGMGNVGCLYETAGYKSIVFKGLPTSEWDYED